MKELAQKIVLAICLSMICHISTAQTIIQMEEYGGVYRIPCKVNGAKMKLIFDTGAESVCLSLTMAEYLFDNDFISNNDIKGNGSSQVADGSIVDHIKINIKDIEIQGIHLKNVEAVVIDGQNAPLLLGQSAIKKLGEYSISGNKLIIGASNPSQQTNGNVLKEEDVSRILNEANNARSKGMYRIAIEKYKELYDRDLLNPLDVFGYALCLEYVEDYKMELQLLQAIQPIYETEYSYSKDIIYGSLGKCYEGMGDYDAALLNYEKYKYYSEPFSWAQTLAVGFIAGIYEKKGNYYMSRRTWDNYISEFLINKKIRATDCWTASHAISPDDAITLADLYYQRSLANESYCDDSEKYMIIAAAWGSEKAIKWCREHYINYLTKPSKYSY